jgi:hypothetical protein
VSNQQYTIDERIFYVYLAQLRAMDAHQEANAVQVLATLFEPTLVIDEVRIERMVRERLSHQVAQP